MTKRLPIAAAVFALAACQEVPQDAEKAFAGEEQTKPHVNDRFKGNRALYEKTMRERAKFQDEYLRLRPDQ